MAMDKKQINTVKKIADTEVRKGVKGHEKSMHGMKKGGVTSLAMKQVGRNMARANNQRGK
jgi:hypothetical protein